jgi:glycosyltransferase involved in cell wall biosynthesis
VRILQLTPGTGSFYCGSCLRDNALVRALRDVGHDAQIAPLYLPFKLEDARGEGAGGARGTGDEVHMGGINVYLQQFAPWLSHMPRFLAKALDSPRLLRFVSARSNMTDPSGLGALTLSVLRGEEGRQVGEVDKLISWIKGLEKPDVILLSNAMLLGLARRIKEEVGCPVLCTLQGEAPFLDALSPKHSDACWQTLTERARDIAAFLPVSKYTGDLMGERLSLDPARVHVVHNGIELDEFRPSSAAPAQPTIGFLARLCADKGLPQLVDAFIELHQRGSVAGLQLRAGGVCLSVDEPLVRAQEQKLRDAGISVGPGAEAEIRRGLSVPEKLELLQGSTLLSVPAEYGESFGLYLLEAMATGVPVVQPRIHGFPEVVEATGGGVLYEPGGKGPANALANALEGLLLEPGKARALGESARAAIQANFTTERMARDVAEVCRMAAGMDAAS